MASKEPVDLDTEPSGQKVPPLDPLNFLIMKLSTKLSNSDVENMKLLLHRSHISESEEWKLHTAADCFKYLKERGFISKHNLSLLILVFKQLKKQNLISMVSDFLELPPALAISDGHKDFVECARWLRKRYKGYQSMKPFAWSSFTLSDDSFVRLQLESSCEEIQIDDIFTAGFKSHSIRRIFIRGKEGYGKSVLCRKLAHEWAVARMGNPLEDCSLVLYCHIFKTDKSLQNAIFRSVQQSLNNKKQFWDDIQTTQGSICFLIDGFYDIPQDSDNDVHELLSGSLFPSSKIIVTSRTPRTHSTWSAHRYDQYLNLMGLSDARRQRYTDMRSESEQTLMSKIETHGYVANFHCLKKNPRDFQRFFELLNAGYLEASLDITKTKLYDTVFNALFKKKSTKQISDAFCVLGCHIASSWFPSEKLPQQLKRGKQSSTMAFGFEGSTHDCITEDLTINEFFFAKYMTRLLHEKDENSYEIYLKLLVEHIDQFSQVITFLVGLEGEKALNVFGRISKEVFAQHQGHVSFKFIFQLLQESDRSPAFITMCAKMLPVKVNINLPLSPCFERKLVYDVLSDEQIMTNEIDLTFKIDEVKNEDFDPKELTESCDILKSYQNVLNLNFSESIYSCLNSDGIDNFFRSIPEEIMHKTQNIYFCLPKSRSESEVRTSQQKIKLIASLRLMNLIKKDLSSCYVKNVTYSINFLITVCLFLAKCKKITFDMVLTDEKKSIFKNMVATCDELARNVESVKEAVDMCVKSVAVNPREGKYILTCTSKNTESKSDECKLSSVDFRYINVDNNLHFRDFIRKHDGIEELTFDGCETTYTTLADICEVRRNTLTKLSLRPLVTPSVCVSENLDAILFIKSLSAIESLQFLHLRDFCFPHHDLETNKPWHDLICRDKLTEMHLDNCFSDSVSTTSTDTNPVISALVERKTNLTLSSLKFSLWRNTLTNEDIRLLLHAGLIQFKEESFGQLYQCTVSNASLRLLTQHGFDVNSLQIKDT